MHKNLRNSAHEGLDILLDLIDEAKSTTDDEKHNAAISAAFVFLYNIAGDMIAERLKKSGSTSLPGETKVIEEDQPYNYMKRVLARAILDMKPILELANINAGLAAHDLIQMSKYGGADAKVLTRAKRGKGQSNDMDLKPLARNKFVKLVHSESGRIGKSIENILDLFVPITDEDGDKESKSFDARKRLWETMSAEVSIAERRKAKKLGATLTQAPYTQEQISKLWELAKKK